jgi:hypothetical protein
LEKYKEYQHAWNDYEEKVHEKLKETEYVKKGKDTRNRNVKKSVNKSFVKQIGLLLNNKDQLSKQSYKNTSTSQTPINAEE